MQHLRKLDASTEAQMGRQQAQPGAAGHGLPGDPRQQGDSLPKPEAWSEGEQAAFVLGLHLWGEQFTSIQALIGTKTVRQSHREKCLSAGRMGSGWGLPSALPRLAMAPKQRLHSPGAPDVGPDASGCLCSEVCL